MKLPITCAGQKGIPAVIIAPVIAALVVPSNPPKNATTTKIEANTLEFNYQNVDLNQLAKDVENTVRGRLQTGVALQFVPEVPVCYVQTEHNRLSQVLINLLVNAAKFTEKGEIMFGYKIRGEELYFYVKDTGIGISLENQKKIFERFTKVNTFIQGTGLGLSICKNIVTKRVFF